MAGHVLGIIAAFFWKVPAKIIVGTIPLAVDGTVQKLTDYESNNRRRFITGVLYGFSFMSACICGVRWVGKKICA